MDDRTAVLMPLPGIGDLVWHIPFIHAVAQATSGGRVTLITKPRTGAEDLLRADETIEAVVHIDRNRHGRRGRHDGVIGPLRLARLFREYHLERLFIFHKSRRYALAARLAGIRDRFGYSIGGRGLRDEFQRLHPYEQAARFVDQLGIAVTEAEPRLAIAADAAAAVRACYGHLPRPMIAFGLGSSEPYKRWPAARFGTLADRLVAAGWGTIFLVGGPADAEEGVQARAAAGVASDRLIPAFDLSLDRTAALLSLADGYIGNDTGTLNIAAAVGTRAIGLFGASAPLTHSRRIDVVTPEGGPRRDGGMAAISVAAAQAAANHLRG